MTQTYKSLPWPQNLWSVIFEKKISKEELPKNWEQALEYALNKLGTSKGKAIILYYFKDGMTLQQIGDIYGIKKEAIRQHITKAIRILRCPTRQIFLLLGLHEANRVIAKERKTETPSANNNTIDTLHLSGRVYNCLRRANIETIDQLTRQNKQSLLANRNLGDKAVQEINNALAIQGLSLQV